MLYPSGKEVHMADDLKPIHREFWDCPQCRDSFKELLDCAKGIQPGLGIPDWIKKGARVLYHGVQEGTIFEIEVNNRVKPPEHEHRISISVAYPGSKVASIFFSILPGETDIPIVPI